MFDTPVFKILAHNDTGAAVGHQGGFVIPKDIEAFFPDVVGSITPVTPTIDVPILARLLLNGRFIARTETRYQYQSWGGTRFERRLTSNLGPIRNIAVAGDIVLFARDPHHLDFFEIDLLKQGTAPHKGILDHVGGKRWGPVPGLPTPASNSDFMSAARELSASETSEFVLFDESRGLSMSTAKRRARGAAFRTRLIDEYGLNCMITENPIVSPNGKANIDAAHVVPVEDGGSDDPRNGFLVTKDLHWAFDQGLFAIDDDLSIVVSDHALDSAPNEPLSRLTGKKLKTSGSVMRPHVSALKWHRENKFV